MFLRRRRTITVAIEHRTLTLSASPPASPEEGSPPSTAPAKSIPAEKADRAKTQPYQPKERP